MSTCPGNGVAEDEGVNGRRHPSRHRCLWFLLRLNLSSRFHRPTPPRRRLLTSSLVYQRLPRPSLSRLPASPSRPQRPSSCNLCLSPTPPTAVMSLAGHIAISTASFTPLSRTACYMPLLPTASAMSVSPTERATLMVPTPATSPTASATSPAPTSPLASPASYHGITTAASSTRKRSSLQSSTSRGAYARHLVTIPLHDPRTPQTLLLSLFNARSVSTSRKKTEICNFITDNDVDIMLLTETWLRSSGDEAKCADLAPPGYSSTLFLAHRGLLAVEVGALPSSSETR